MGWDWPFIFPLPLWVWQDRLQVEGKGLTRCVPVLGCEFLVAGGTGCVSEGTAQ